MPDPGPHRNAAQHPLALRILDAANISMPGRLSGYVARLEAVTDRLAPISLECRPTLEVITD